MGEQCLDTFTERTISLLDADERYHFDKKRDMYDAHADVDFDVDILTVREKIHNVTSMPHRWNNYLYNERRILSNLKIKLYETEITIEQFFMRGDDPRFKNLNEKAIKNKIALQPVIKKYKHIIEGQEDIVSYVEGGLKLATFNHKEQCQMILELLKQEQNL